MKKNIITNKITPCCGLPFSVTYWWVSNLTLNSESDRQFILSKISQIGVISIDAWKVLINSGTLEADASLTKAEFLAWFDCERQPSCEQLKLIIEGYKMGSWVGDLNEIRFENVLGVLEISDPAPTTAGLYRLSEVGTYTNLGGLVTTAGKINDAYFDGTTWSKVEVAIPNASTVFDKTNNTTSATMKAIDEWFSIGVNQELETEVAQRVSGYWTDSAVYTANSGYTSTPLVDLTGKIKIRIENFTPPDGDYGIKFYNASNGLVLNHRQNGTFTLTIPSGAVKMQVGTKNYSNQSWKLFTIYVGSSGGTSSIVTSGGNKFRPINSEAILDYTENFYRDSDALEITGRTSGYYNDNGVLTASIHTTTPLTEISEGDEIIFSGINPTNGDYGWRFFDVNNKLIEISQKKGDGNFIIKGIAIKKFAFATATDTTFTISVKKAPYFPKQKTEKTYVEISPLMVNVADMNGATDSAKYDNARSLIKNAGGGTVYFGGRNFQISKSIELASNMKLIIDNCGIETTAGQHDNIIRTPVMVDTNAIDGMALGAELTENFEVKGIGNAYLKKISPSKIGDVYGWRGITMLIANAKNYRVTDLKIIDSPMWSISNEWSSDGYFENIEFATNLTNGDGLNFRNGCNNMWAKTLRGFTNDNGVALTGMVFTNPQYPAQVLGWGFDTDNGIRDIHISDVDMTTKYGTVGIISTGVEISNVFIADVIERRTGKNIWYVLGIGANGIHGYNYGTRYQSGMIHNISAHNLQSVGADAVVEISNPNSVINPFNNILLSKLTQQKAGGTMVIGNANDYTLI